MFWHFCHVPGCSMVFYWFLWHSWNPLCFILSYLISSPYLILSYLLSYLIFTELADFHKIKYMKNAQKLVLCTTPQPPTSAILLISWNFPGCWMEGTRRI